MFGKLLKYDFRSMFKQFAFIWPAALVLALVNHFTLNSFVTSASDTRQTVSGVAMLVYVAILIAMFIIAVVFIIQRFYKGLLGDEGYLMHTLPVKPWQLISSKLLCAVVATFISVVVAILSIFVIFPWGREDFQQLFDGLKYLFSHWDKNATGVVVSILEGVLLMLVSLAAGYLQLYLSMAVGHLFNKNRVAMSVIAFIAVNAVISMVMGFLPDFDVIFDFVFDPNLQGIDLFSRGVWLVIAWEAVISAIFFAGTNFILQKKLNLE